MSNENVFEQVQKKLEELKATGVKEATKLAELIFDVLKSNPINPAPSPVPTPAPPSPAQASPFPAGDADQTPAPVAPVADPYIKDLADPMLGFRFGDWVECIYTGWRGRISSSIHEMNGNVRATVWRHEEDNKDGAQMSIDITSLKFLKRDPDYKPIPLETTGIHLGDYVQHTISGLEGTATERHESSSGCVYFFVQPQASKKQIKNGKLPKKLWVSCEFLEVLESARHTLDEDVKPSGGPSTVTRVSKSMASRA